MTDRHAGYIVVLEENIRDDEAEPTINAIKRIKGVLSVEPIINDGDLAIKEMVAKTRARSWLFDKIMNAFPLSDV